MIDLLPKILKSLEDVEQKESFLSYFSEFEKDSYRSSPLLEYSASFFWIPYQVCKLSHH
jgi:hypothetical protein